MTIELQMLVWSIVLGIVYILVAATASAMRRGGRWAAGARDEPVAALTGVAGRLERAQRNFLETFPFFAAAVLAIAVLDRYSDTTALGAQLYFWGRLIYLPLYALGTYLVRSLAWGVALVGLVMLLVALFQT
jgi:uncharacterized MAPEG superfamily protein